MSVITPHCALFAPKLLVPTHGPHERITIFGTAAFGGESLYHKPKPDETPIPGLPGIMVIAHATLYRFGNAPDCFKAGPIVFSGDTIVVLLVLL